MMSKLTCPFCKTVGEYPSWAVHASLNDSLARVSCVSGKCRLSFWPGKPHVLQEVDNISGLVRVRRLIDGIVPNTIFLLLPNAYSDSLTIELFTRMDSLPDDLRKQVTHQNNMTVYRQLEQSLRDCRVKDDKVAEDLILERMTSLWGKLSEDQRNQLDAEGATCWPDKEK